MKRVVAGLLILPILFGPNVGAQVPQAPAACIEQIVIPQTEQDSLNLRGRVVDLVAQVFEGEEGHHYGVLQTKRGWYALLEIYNGIPKGLEHYVLGDDPLTLHTQVYFTVNVDLAAQVNAALANGDNNFATFLLAEHAAPDVVVDDVYSSESRVQRPTFVEGGVVQASSTYLYPGEGYDRSLVQMQNAICDMLNI